jgi:hypothetical protein
MKKLAVIVGFLVILPLMTSCSDGSEEATWRGVNKKFVELENERGITFDLLKDKPSKSKSEK